MKKVALTLISTFLLASLASCSTPASQCKQFAEVTRQYQTLRDSFEANIESAQVKASGAQSLPEVHAAATAYTGAVDTITGELDAMLKDLSGLNVSDPQLDEYRESYIITLTGSKTALKMARDAMQLIVNAKTETALRDVFNQYQTQGNRAYDDILTLDAKESALVDQVNQYCAQSFE